MEDFSEVYTIEYNGSKGWEVIWTGKGLTEAVNEFRVICIRDEGEFRLTTPKHRNLFGNGVA